MSKILVVYYSRAGHNTHDLAETVAAACGADLEAIQDGGRHAGFFGYWRAGREALTKTGCEIEPTAKNPADYDLVLLGTPVWAGNMSSPMRTYITQQSRSFKRIALFCTEGSAGGEGVMKQMAELCGQEPAATLIVTEKELKSGSFRDKAKAFAAALSVPA